MCPHLLGFSPRSRTQLGEELIRALPIAVGDERRTRIGRIGQLIAEASIPFDAGTLQERRNFVCDGERLLIDDQFFEASGTHDRAIRMNRTARSVTAWHAYRLPTNSGLPTPD